eukprot:5159422-Pyramimonas_sp.AAC.2
MQTLLQRAAFGTRADVARQRVHPRVRGAHSTPKTVGAKGFGEKATPKQPVPSKGKSVVQKKVQANNNATTKKVRPISHQGLQCEQRITSSATPTSVWNRWNSVPPRKSLS